MPFATAGDGTRLHFEVTGRADANPLLLVSGQGQGAEMWGDARGDFENDHRVLVWDHRGTGLSDKPERPPYSIEMFARDATSVLDAAGVGRAHVYGVSMGGRVAQRMAIDFPDRCGAVVLGCASPGNPHGVQRDPDVLSIMVGARDDPALSDAAVELMVTPAWTEANPDAAERVRRMAASPIPDHARLMHFLASEAHEAWEELHRSGAPCS